MECEDCKKEIKLNEDVYYIVMNEDPNKPIIKCELCVK